MQRQQWECLPTRRRSEKTIGPNSDRRDDLTEICILVALAYNGPSEAHYRSLSALDTFLLFLDRVAKMVFAVFIGRDRLSVLVYARRTYQPPTIFCFEEEGRLAWYFSD